MKPREDLVEEIGRRREALMQRIAGAAIRSGRDPASIEVVAVSKNQPMEKIYAAWEVGIRNFGENRAQEFLSKHGEIKLDVNWHFVGHLQTNKAKMITGKVCLIHSIDSVKIATEVNRQAAAQGIKQDILIQVNESGESSKFGFLEEEVEEALALIGDMPNVKVRGLMTIAPLTDDQEKVRASFRKLAELRSLLQEKYPQLDLGILSMGMTEDFEVAVEEGTNMLRIGTAIFGPRGNLEEKG